MGKNDNQMTLVDARRCLDLIAQGGQGNLDEAGAFILGEIVSESLNTRDILIAACEAVPGKVRQPDETPVEATVRMLQGYVDLLTRLGTYLGVDPSKAENRLDAYFQPSQSGDGGHH